MTRPPKRRDTLRRLERAAMRWYRKPSNRVEWMAVKEKSLYLACAAHAAAKGKRGK